MDKREFLLVIAALKSNYQNWQFNTDDVSSMKLWYESLKHIPYEVANAGVLKLIATEEFYPNIAKILKACASIVTLKTTEPTEAWGLVQRAIRNYGYMRADEALRSLPEDVAKAVMYMGGWQALCESENPEADRAHFYKTMESIERRQQSESVLSGSIAATIEKYQQIAFEESKKNREQMLLEESNKQKQIEQKLVDEVKTDEMASFADVMNNLRKKVEEKHGTAECR